MLIFWRPSSPRGRINLLVPGMSSSANGSQVAADAFVPTVRTQPAIVPEPPRGGSGGHRGPVHGRRRSWSPHRTGRGNYVNYGPQALDAVSGLSYPKRLMVPQRGGLVSKNWADGSLDAVDPIDRQAVSPMQLPTPFPLYRLRNVSGMTLLATSEDERDEAVEAGYSWLALGHAYIDGDEEDNLVLLYRSFNRLSGDRIFTVSAVEHLAALVAGYTVEIPDTYVSTTPAANRIPIYRAFNAATSLHTWSADPRDFERLGSAWVLQEISFYLWSGPERTRSN